MKKQIKKISKEYEVQQRVHVTQPPRLEGGAKNAMMNPVRKKKKKNFKKINNVYE